MNTTVKDVMTTRVIWVTKDATFREMAAALREHRVSAFPVVDDDRKVIGVVSEADMLNKEALIDEPGVISGILHHRDQVKARGITAGDLMTTAVVAVRPDDTVEHAAKLMYDRAVKRLPVTDESGRLVGIISRADVLSVFDRTDAAIGHEITRDVLLGEFMVDPLAFQVTVMDGIVTLAGRPETTETGHQIVWRVRHVPGVVAVRDRLTTRPPSVSAGTTCWPTSRWTERDDDHERHGQGRDDHRGGGGQERDHLQGDGGRARRYRVSALPVVDDAGRVLGVVSEADLLAKEALADPGPVAELVHRKDLRKAEGLTAGDLMTSPPVTATPDDPVEQAARMMHFMRVKRLPVVNSGGQLVGIISRADVLAVFDRADEDIRKDIADAILLHEFLIDPRQFRVTVESGVVTMEGTPETAAFGHALIRKARHVPGVVAVRDRLSYPDVYPVVAGPVY
jgi:CBS domain-containing protein/osmotically-inducible protein OsmY